MIKRRTKEGQKKDIWGKKKDIWKKKDKRRTKEGHLEKEGQKKDAPHN